MGDHAVMREQARACGWNKALAMRHFGSRIIDIKPSAAVRNLIVEGLSDINFLVERGCAGWRAAMGHGEAASIH